MKSYCKIMLMCMQATVLFGMQLGTPSTREGRRRSPVRPPVKTGTTSDRSVPIDLKKSAEIAIPIALTESGEIRFRLQAKSPKNPETNAVSPGDYLGWYQGCSPDYRD